MPSNAFIRFQKIDGGTAIGESLQVGHLGKDGWSPIANFNWKAEHPHRIRDGGGGSGGKPKSNELSFTYSYEKSSPLIMQFIVGGVHFQSVTIDMLKQVGGTEPKLYFQLILREVFITKISSKSGDDGVVTQDVEMVFKQIAMGYKRQRNDGQLDKALFFRWNIGEGTQQTPLIQFAVN